MIVNMYVFLEDIYFIYGKTNKELWSKDLYAELQMVLEVQTKNSSNVNKGIKTSSWKK